MKNMKILILNTSERVGGASVAANRLMKALDERGLEARMLVRDKQTDDPRVVSINNGFLTQKINRLRFVWERFVIFLYNRFSKKNLFAVSIANTGSNINKHPLVREADIIHLHWVNQGFLSLKNIRQLTKLKKPIVWTMHDMWPCTGICHHARTCVNYQSFCRNCFFLQYASKKDLSTRIFNKKFNIFKTSNITFVTCSEWLCNMAKTSTLFANKQIIAIPNPIDTRRFNKTHKNTARSYLGLPENKQLLLFSAVNLSDQRKGFDYMAKAINLLADYKDSLELVMVGNKKQGDITALPLNVHYIPYITEEDKMATLYNAIDIYVTPSLEENLPNTIMEAMACGTPCAGFNTGGIPKMIDHKINGYLATYKSADDLAAGIRWVLSEADYNTLSEKAVEKVQSHYAEQIVAAQYVELYKSVQSSNF